MSAVSALLSAATVDAIPRDYNFARDLMDRPRSTEELDRTAYIDVRGHWSYRQLRGRVEQCSRVIESLPVRPEAALTSSGLCTASSTSALRNVGTARRDSR